jgi:hypothetical protein
MAAASTMTGARAKIVIANPNADGYTGVVGMFSDCSFSYSLDLQPIYILGNAGPVESVYTAQEPIRVTCNGFRSVDNGPFAQAGMPPLNQLLTHEYMQIELFDRQSGKSIGIVKQCRPQGFDSGVSARQITSMSLTYMGLLFSDETTEERSSAGKNEERADANVYPGGR